MYAIEQRTDTSESEVGDYLRVLRRRKWWIIVTVLVVVGLATLNSVRQTPRYRATAELLLRPESASSIFGSSNQTPDPSRTIANEIKVIQSTEMQQAATKALGHPARVSAAGNETDDTIVVAATGSNPKKVANMVNVYTQTYQQTRLAKSLEDNSRAQQELNRQIQEFQAEIDKVQKPLDDLDAQLAVTPEGEERQRLLDLRANVASQVQPEVQSRQSQLNEYEQRLRLLQVNERLTDTGGVQILNPASVPKRPFSPNVRQDIVQALFLGLVLGIALAFIREQFDESVRTKVDLERATKGTEVIGLIPSDSQWRDREAERIITQLAPLAPEAEAYRGLRTAMQFMALEQPLGVVQVTSATAGEGKSSTVANLAITFAQAGKKVAVVGCDLRKPRIHRFLGCDGSVGLTSVLLGDCTLEEALQQSPVEANVSVLASGPRPPNPSELLSLERTASLVRSLLETHNLVLVDTPPVLPVTDAMVVSRFVDATLFMAMANQATKRQVRRAYEMLEQVNVPVIGSVLNGVEAEQAYSSLYDYYGIYQPSSARGSWFSRLLGRRGDEDEPVSTADPSDLDAEPEHVAKQ